MTPTPSTTIHRRSVARQAGLFASLLAFASATSSRGGETGGVDSLDQNALQLAFRALREHSLMRKKLTDLAVNRAALNGILESLGPGAELVPAETAESDETREPFTNLVAPLSGGITYVRAAVLDDAFVQTLRDLPPSETGLILDLRCPGGALDTTRASQCLSAFCPPDERHFSIEDSGGTEFETFTQSIDPRHHQETLVLLVDADSSPTSETIAAVIRFHLRTRCLLIGEPTPGRAALYETLALGNNALLRYAKAGVKLPDGSLLFRNGLIPDIPIESDRVAVENTLSLTDTESFEKYFTEIEKPVFNEAALIAGTNPELPAQLAKPASGAAEPVPPPLRDPALRQAIDFLTTRAFLESKP